MNASYRAILFVVGSCSLVHAQSPGKAMVAAPYNPPLRVGEKVVGTWDTLECTVERYQGDWAWIRTDDGKHGWVRSSEVVPLDKAVEYFTQKIEAGPSNVGWRQARAIAYERQGDIDRAIADIGEAIKLAPEDVYHYYNTRGNFYLLQKDYDRALEDYNQSLRLRPNHAYAWNNAGLARRAKGDYDKAVENLTRAIELDPQYANAYDSRARVWTDKRDYDRALADYGRALELDPQLADLYIGRAAVWEAKGEYAKALADLAKAEQIDANDAEPHNGRAWLLATCPDDQVRDGQQAVAEAQKACELTQWKDFNCIDTLAAAYAETGDFENAVTYVERAIEQAPDDKKAGYQERLEQYRQKKPYRQQRPE